MPSAIYEVELPDGRIMEVEGDRAPSRMQISRYLVKEKDHGPLTAGETARAAWSGAAEPAARILETVPGPAAGIATAATGYGIPASAGMAGAAAALGRSAANAIRGTVASPLDPIAYGSTQALGFALPAVGRVTNRATALLNPQAAMTKEVLAGMGAGGAAGVGLDALNQGAMTGEVNWRQALGSGVATMVLGGVGGALQAHEVGRLAATDAASVLKAARELGFEGRTFADMRRWYGNAVARPPQRVNPPPPAALPEVAPTAAEPMAGRPATVPPQAPAASLPLSPSLPTPGAMAAPESPMIGVGGSIPPPAPAVAPAAPLALMPPGPARPWELPPAVSPEIMANFAAERAAPAIQEPPPIAAEVAAERAGPPAMQSPAVAAPEAAAALPATPPAAVPTAGESWAAIRQQAINHQLGLDPNATAPKTKDKRKAMRAWLAERKDEPVNPSEGWSEYGMRGATFEELVPSLAKTASEMLRNEYRIGPGREGGYAVFVRPAADYAQAAERENLNRQAEDALESTPPPAPTATPPAAPSKWLKVTPPAENAAAVENMRTAERKKEELNARARELSGVKKQIEKLVIKSTGPRWERGKIKKSAKASDVAAYNKVNKDLAELQTQQSALYAMTRGDAKAVQLAKYAATINDASAPLVSRYAARLNLENDQGGDASQYDDLIAEWQAAARDEIMRKHPDATPEEVKYLNAPIERAAYGATTRQELDRAWEMDPSLSLQSFRRAELDKTIEEVRFGQWANEIPDLRTEVGRYTATGRNYQNSRDPIEPLTRENLAGLQKRVRSARADEEQRQTAVKALQEQAAAARATRADLTAVVSDKGITIAAAPPTERRISKLADKKQLKAQGEFLEKTLRELAKKAPDDNAIHADYQDDYTAILTEQANWRANEGDLFAARRRIEGLADKIIPGWQETLRKDKTGNYNADTVADNVIYAIRGRVPDGTPGQIVIEVPGDGTFRFQNWKKTLENAADSVGKGLGKGLQYQGPTTPATSARSLPRAVKQAPADINKVLADFTKDDKRHVLKDVIQDGPWTVASDGHLMVISKGGTGKGRAEVEGEFPTWRAFLADSSGISLSDKAGDRIILGPGNKFQTSLDDLLKKANSAVSALSDDGKKDWVQIHLGDKVGLSYSHPEVGDYVSDGVSSGQESDGAINAYQLRDVLEGLRKLGATDLTIMAPRQVGKDGLSPWVFRGSDSALAVIQPLTGARNEREPAPKIDELIAAAPAPVTSKEADAPTPEAKPQSPEHRLAMHKQDIIGELGVALNKIYPYGGLTTGGAEDTFMAKAIKALGPIGVPEDVVRQAREIVRSPGQVIIRIDPQNLIRGLGKYGWIERLANERLAKDPAARATPSAIPAPDAAAATARAKPAKRSRP